MFSPQKTSLWWPILLALLTGMSFVPGASAQGNGGTILTVVVPALNVRSGLGLTYPAVTKLTTRDTLAVVGQASAHQWWQVQLFNGQTGWVSD